MVVTKYDTLPYNLVLPENPSSLSEKPRTQDYQKNPRSGGKTPGVGALVAADQVFALVIFLKKRATKNRTLNNQVATNTLKTFL